MEGKELHDALLDRVASGTDTHDSKTCGICQAELRGPVTAAADDDPGGNRMSQYTQEQVDGFVADAVAKAVGPLQTQLDELTGSANLQRLADAIAEQVSPVQARVTELEDELANEKLRADEAERQLAELSDLLVAADAKRKEDEEAEARKETRLKAVRDAIPTVKDEWLNEQADRVSRMSDEEFTERLAEWASIAGAGTPPIPGETALSTTRMTAAADGGMDDVRAVMAMQFQGHDPRRL